MRAAVLTGQGEPLDLVELPDPTPAPDEVVLRVDACGICGSDLHLADAYPLPGVVLGHELCGTVVAIGSEVTELRDGDRVAALSLSSCGRCGACLTGRPRKCRQVSMVGIDRPGGYAEYATITAHDAFRLPERLDARHGALIEPLAVALHTVDRAALTPGEDALVLGAGPIGQAVAAWLRHTGAREVVVSDPVAHRRELAGSVGATATVDPTTDDVASRFRTITGADPTVVIECVGLPGLIQQAVDLVDVDGRVIVAGVCMGADTVMPLTAMVKEIDLRYAFYYRARDYQHTITMIDQGRLDPLPLVTAEIALDDLPDRFEALKRPSDECKVLIRP